MNSHSIFNHTHTFVSLVPRQNDKILGLPFHHATMERFLANFGQRLINDRSTTWRNLTEEEKNLLLDHVSMMRQEYADNEAEFEGLWDAAYEGRRGCSPRGTAGTAAPPR